MSRAGFGDGALLRRTADEPPRACDGKELALHADMKKTKLRLSRQTIAVLVRSRLATAAGGKLTDPIETVPPEPRTNSISPCCASLYQVCPQA